MVREPTNLRYLPHVFCAVAGAALASWITHRLSTMAGEGASPAPRVVYLPAPEAPRFDTDLLAEETETMARANAELTDQLEEVLARLMEQNEVLALTRENLAELRRPMDADVLSSTLRAELKSGEVVVTGGYRLPDGTRAYAFVQPVVVQENGRDMLEVTGVLRAVDDDMGSAVGLDNLATNADNTLQHGEVWVEDERRVIFEALDHVSAPAGVNLPKVSVAMGNQARIRVGDMSIQVQSTLGDDRETLDFEVRLEQARPATVESAPDAIAAP